MHQGLPPLNAALQFTPPAVAKPSIDLPVTPHTDKQNNNGICQYANQLHLIDAATLRAMQITEDLANQHSNFLPNQYTTNLNMNRNLPMNMNMNMTTPLMIPPQNLNMSMNIQNNQNQNQSQNQSPVAVNNNNRGRRNNNHGMNHRRSRMIICIELCMKITWIQGKFTRKFTKNQLEMV